MNSSRTVCVRVPASTANLGPGFDCLGMALNVYTWVAMRFSDNPNISLFGDELQGIPTDASNLVYRVAQQLFRRAGERDRPLSIDMYSDIPLARGMGSSASAIVGALVAANGLIGSPFGPTELFRMATELEGHPDNVGASLFGGIVAATWDGTDAYHIRFDAPPRLAAVMLIPDFHLATDYARSVLPDNVSMNDAVLNASRSALLVASIASGQLDMIRHAMKDVLHEPYRAKLIPGMDRVLAGACDNGALGAALSGAGPSLIAFVDSAAGLTDDVEHFTMQTMEEAGVSCRIVRLLPESGGASVWNSYDPDRSLPVNIQQAKGALSL